MKTIFRARATTHLFQGVKTFGPEVIKLFSCSAQLRMKFEVLINTEISKIN